MNKRIYYLIITALLPFLLNIYIDYKIEKLILPLRLDIVAIKVNHKFWIKEISNKGNLI
jgi:hypothetical protein